MIDVQQVRELAAVMAERGLSEIRIREGETALSLRRGPLAEAPVWAPPMAMPAPLAQAAAVPQAESHSGEENLVAIKSPMVGTFYSRSDPESPPFVQLGSEVEPNSPACIIEAMKVFNEIKAEVSGTVERILVQDEQAVEFGQTLMLVRPRG